MDLLLICVESGMSIEQAFRKVSQEIGLQSIPLAEELTLTTAELSYLPERRTAYENLAKRTGIESTKQIVTVLVQAEKYGTPLGHALRVLGQESRDHRLLLAEQKAAALLAEAHGADDHFLSAGAVCRHHDAGDHPDQRRCRRSQHRIRREAAAQHDAPYG